jgi:hypothetical protein
MQFRNIDIQPNAPVERWGFEGVLTAFERGDLSDWHRIYLACREDRTGKMRLIVAEALDALEHGELRPQLASVFRLLLEQDAESQ